MTASYFDGQLTEPEATALAHVLDRDIEKADRFVAQYEIDRLLTLRASPADERRIDAVVEQIQREADPFVQGVVGAIGLEGLNPTARTRSWRDLTAHLFSRARWARAELVGRDSAQRPSKDPTSACTALASVR